MHKGLCLNLIDHLKIVFDCTVMVGNRPTDTSMGLYRIITIQHKIMNIACRGTINNNGTKRILSENGTIDLHLYRPTRRLGFRSRTISSGFFIFCGGRGHFHCQGLRVFSGLSAQVGHARRAVLGGHEERVEAVHAVGEALR